VVKWGKANITRNVPASAEDETSLTTGSFCVEIELIVDECLKDSVKMLVADLNVSLN
jgi:hypothetical protein